MEDHLLLDKLTLHVKIEDENQVFSNYTYNGDNLSHELGDYLLEKAETARPIPLKENFIINIHTQNHNLRLPEITRCIHRHFHNEYDAEKRKLHSNLNFALALFALGLFILVLRFLAINYFNNFFVTEILNITSWVFIWAGVEVIVLERSKIIRRCNLLRRLAYAEVMLSDNPKLEAPIYI